MSKLTSVEVTAARILEIRNIKRFPEDFMFHLTENDVRNLRSQIVTSS